jgi:syntaxin 16
MTLIHWNSFLIFLYVVTTGGSPSKADHSYKKLTAGGHDLMLAEEGIQMTSMGQPPAWVNDVQAVEGCLTKINSMMEQLKSMHAQRVGSVFGKDLQNMEGKIERYTQDLTDQFRYAERLLQKVGMATRRVGGEEAMVGANVQRRYVASQIGNRCDENAESICSNSHSGSLAKRLQEQSLAFRQSQRKYLAEVQTQKSGGLAPDLGGLDLGVESGDFFTTQQMAVVDDLTAAVHSRDQEIVKIAQSIEELGTIFKELAVLVIDQGTILDRIDYNMEAVVEHTKTGIKQLEKAEKHQKSARPMRCIICLSITIFILLFILVLKHRPRRGWL